MRDSKTRTIKNRNIRVSKYRGFVDSIKRCAFRNSPSSGTVSCTENLPLHKLPRILVLSGGRQQKEQAYSTDLKCAWPKIQKRCRLFGRKTSSYRDLTFLNKYVTKAINQQGDWGIQKAKGTNFLCLPFSPGLGNGCRSSLITQ